MIYNKYGTKSKKYVLNQVYIIYFHHYTMPSLL